MIADDIDKILDTAVTFFHRGDHPRTEEICKSILNRDASHCGALQLLAAVAGQQDRHAEAVDWLDRALRVAPANPALLTHRGTCLKALGRLDESVTAHRAALALQPHIPEIHYNLGNALSALELKADAASAFLRAAELKPNFAQAWLNAANTLTALGDIEHALSAYRRALALDPEDPEVHWNYSLACLLIGDFHIGWREYEWRWRRSERQENLRLYPQPLWRGESDLAGKIILLWAEQGLGDTLQFIRFLPAVAKRCAHVVLEAQTPLARLLKGAPGLDTLVQPGEPLPHFDRHCPLMSLPLALGIANEPISGAPYLEVPAAATVRQTRLATLRSANRPRIGFVWRGHPKHHNDKKRSLSLQDILSFLGTASAEIDWFCLQQPITDSDRVALSSRPNVHLLDTLLNDFADTAAAISALDLVITVDTSIAHLAGALGRPVWVLLPYAPDWRWQRDRSDSPWYASARLFRQTSAGDWRGVLTVVRHELAVRFATPG